ncbi:hypothetical protein CSUB01_11836, partial [Colletotrichum sublineola]
LILDPGEFVERSLEDGQDILAKEEAVDYVEETLQPMLNVITDDFKNVHNHRQRSFHVKYMENLLNIGDVPVDLHFIEVAFSSTWALDVLQAIFSDLKARKLSGNSVDAFDICSIVYKTGWNDMPTLLSQGRDGEISGTSARKHLRSLHEPNCIISHVARTIENEQKSRVGRAKPTHGDANGSFGASLILERQSNDGKIKTEAQANNRPTETMNLDWSTLADVVSVMVPLLCTQSSVLGYLDLAELLLGIGSFTSFINIGSLPTINFSAFVSLRTRSYGEQIQTSIHDIDFRPLSRCLLAQGRLYTWNGGPSVGATEAPSTRTWAELPLDNRQKAVHEAEIKLKKLERTVRSWVIEEKVIVVMLRAFVVKIMALCGALVVGGILAGILLGERLQGVDPFNITTLAWVLAGFIILVAKSLFVSEWPWRDFLRGRVPCRSVSELHTVTGVDEQDIMEYLLAKEPYTILITKGPFNRTFTRRSNEGFSIDAKMELHTLVASGIIVLKVATQMGPALVCLDIRRGASGRSVIEHSDGPEDDEQLVGCFDFPEAFDKEDEVPLQTLSKERTKPYPANRSPLFIICLPGKQPAHPTYAIIGQHRFEQLLKEKLLPAAYCAYLDELNCLYALMKEDRRMLSNGSSPVVFHLLIPAWYKIDVKEPLHFPDELQPLRIAGMRHSGKPLVSFNLPASQENLLDGVANVLDPEGHNMRAEIADAATFLVGGGWGTNGVCLATGVFLGGITGLGALVVIPVWFGGFMSVGAPAAAYAAQTIHGALRENAPRIIGSDDRLARRSC